LSLASKDRSFSFPRADDRGADQPGFFSFPSPFRRGLAPPPSPPSATADLDRLPYSPPLFRCWRRGNQPTFFPFFFFPEPEDGGWGPRARRPLIPPPPCNYQHWDFFPRKDRINGTSSSLEEDVVQTFPPFSLWRSLKLPTLSPVLSPQQGRDRPLRV